MSEPTTREQWLLDASANLAHLFGRVGLSVPPVHVSCGFPSKSALSRKSLSLGECWSHKASPDEMHHIFVSPLISDPVEALRVLLHEMVHACVGVDKKHGNAFMAAASKVGLEPPAKSTPASSELLAELSAMAESMGAYPHPGLVPPATEKKQTTRMLKLQCPCCGYVVRTTAKWLEVGLPTCPSGTNFVPEIPEDEGEETSDV